MSYILIVDDDQTMAKTLSDMVKLLDWETQVVNSPRAAIETIRSKRPGLIFLDLNMPGVDGLEVCRYIQREPSSAGTPVVFVSAEDDPGIKQRAKEAGAMEYLVKPVDFDQLEQTLKKIPVISADGMTPARIQPPTSKPSPAAVPTVSPPQPAATPASKPTPSSGASIPVSAPPSAPEKASTKPPANLLKPPRPEITQPIKQSDLSKSS